MSDAPPDVEADRFDWLFGELTLTAERAQNHGLSPGEFYAGLLAYQQQFEANYTDAVADLNLPDDHTSTEDDPQ